MVKTETQALREIAKMIDNDSELAVSEAQSGGGYVTVVGDEVGSFNVTSAHNTTDDGHLNKSGGHWVVVSYTRSDSTVEGDGFRLRFRAGGVISDDGRESMEVIQAEDNLVEKTGEIKMRLKRWLVGH